MVSNIKIYTTQDCLYTKDNAPESMKQVKNDI